MIIPQFYSYSSLGNSKNSWREIIMIPLADVDRPYMEGGAQFSLRDIKKDLKAGQWNNQSKLGLKPHPEINEYRDYRCSTRKRVDSVCVLWVRLERGARQSGNELERDSALFRQLKELCWKEGINVLQLRRDNWDHWYKYLQDFGHIYLKATPIKNQVFQSSDYLSAVTVLATNR